MEKIVLVDVQKEIFPDVEKTLINLLHNSGYPAIKIEKKIDFDDLYKKNINWKNFFLYVILKNHYVFVIPLRLVK